MNPLIDPERLHAAFTALPGALLYGVYHLFALVFSGQPVSLHDYIKAGVNLLCALAAGATLAYFLVKPLTAWIPFAALRDQTAVAFVIGALGWELLPIAVAAARGRLGKLGGS